MDDETKTPPGGPPGDPGQPGTKDAAEGASPSVDRAGGGTPAPASAPQGAASGETSPGPQQVQAGMRS